MRKVKRLDDRALDALVAEKILGFVCYQEFNPTIRHWCYTTT